MKTIVYNKFSGEIIRVITSSVTMAYLQAGINEEFILDLECSRVNDELYYIDVKSQVPLEKMYYSYVLETPPLALVIYGLPSEVSLSVSNLSIVTDNEDTEITFDVPGVYRLSLSGNCRYRDETIEVTIDG